MNHTVQLIIIMIIIMQLLTKQNILVNLLKGGLKWIVMDIDVLIASLQRL